VSKDNLEYLQIDLQTLKVVTLIETQGRFGQGQVNMLVIVLAQMNDVGDAIHIAFFSCAEKH